MRSSIEARTAPAQSPVPPVPSAHKSHQQHNRHRRQRSSSPKLWKTRLLRTEKLWKNRANSRIWLCAANAEVSFPSSSLSLLLSALYRHRIEKLQAFTPLSTSRCQDLANNFAVTMTLFFLHPCETFRQPSTAKAVTPSSRRSTHTKPKARNFVQGLSNLFFHAVSTLHLTPSMKKAEKKTVSMTLRAYTGFYSTLRYFTTRSAIREAASVSIETS